MSRRNRYYDPTTGQFTQEDPLGLAGGMNAYGFAGGDPVNFSDPLGLCKTLADGSTDPKCEERAKKVQELTETVTRRVNQWNAAMRAGRDHTSTGHQRAMQGDRKALQRNLDELDKCDDDDDFGGTKSAALDALGMSVQQGPGRYPRKVDIPARQSQQMASGAAPASAAAAATAASVFGEIISDGWPFIFAF